MSLSGKAWEQKWVTKTQTTDKEMRNRVNNVLINAVERMIKTWDD